MTKLTPELARGQLDRTVGTLGSETRLLMLYVKDFLEQLDNQDLHAAGRTMMRTHTLTHAMAPMLKDVRRYTAFLLAEAQHHKPISPGDRRGSHESKRRGP